jgi:polysaccharide biosynthesis transport protein
MEQPGTNGKVSRNKPAAAGNLAVLSPEHYVRLILHRKWVVIITFAVVTAATMVVSSRLPAIYTSETLILVDPQKVPESYVRSTVTGDVRNRLGTLEQQILSSTRLQKIIDSLKLYPEERHKVAREEIIARMRKDITISFVTNTGANQDLQAFRITYSGKEPRLVAQVANELASLFIEENLKAREQQATGTTEFLDNQLQGARKTLEQQEAKLRDFKLRHIGEMPEQQTSNLQVLGQLQSQLQLENEGLSRAEQQRNYIQAMLTQPAVVDIDDGDIRTADEREKPLAPTKSGPALSEKAKLKAQLADKLTHYSENHPDVRKLRHQLAVEEAKEAKEAASKPAEAQAATEPAEVANATPNEPAVPAARSTKRTIRVPVSTSNPVLLSQLKDLDAEIAKHKEEQARLSKRLGSYQSKLEAVPIREQEMTQLVRDYEISKVHYSQLLDKQLSAETATQLEIRQKGEKFSILDAAQPAERPTKPNRPLIDLVGAIAGIALGVMLALVTEFFGASITTADQITVATGIAVLEVIPVIVTRADRHRQRKRLVLATASGLVATVAAFAVLLYQYRARLF